jgi:uncharacterized protein YaaW (UPF0174 family)
LGRIAKDSIPFAIQDARKTALNRTISNKSGSFRTVTLGAGGGINWWTGESLLVLAGPIVVLPTAWIAWRMIRKSYG